MSKCFLCDDVLSACYSFDTAEYCKFYLCPFCKETYCKFCYYRLKLDKSCVKLDKLCVKCDPKNKKAVDQIKYLQSIITDIKQSLDLADDKDAIPDDPPDIAKDGNTDTKP